MCLFAVFYHLDANCPVFVAANREEVYSRSSAAPEIRRSGPAFWLGGVDQLAGGTWLGVNPAGLVVAVTNRRKSVVPTSCRSRGLLCRDLLAFPSAVEALASAQKSIGSFPYDGFNLALIDRQQAFVVEAGDNLRLAVLNRGIHLIANGELNDAHDPRLARVRGFSEALRDAPWGRWPAEFQSMLGEHATEAAPPVCLHHGDRGTVSASVIALPADLDRSEYWYAPGPPCTTAFEDFSPLLRDMLAADPAQEQES